MAQQDDMGTRLKGYEAQETQRYFLSQLPIYARIDGRSFHTFTRGMKRPYDELLSRCMIETTKVLVDKFNAKIGYTQSDEISLVFHQSSSESDQPFGGKVHKLTSLLASMASVAFYREAHKYWPDHVEQALPHFDARVFVLPNKTEVANTFLWREQDATKNAISMAAQSMFSHKALQGLSGKEMQELMWQEKGVNFNDYPAFFKRGTFVRRELVEIELSEEILAKIPENRRPENARVVRSKLTELDMPKFSTVLNRVSVIFDGAAPVVETQD